jgi:hypothetical protein
MWPTNEKIEKFRNYLNTRSLDNMQIGLNHAMSPAQMSNTIGAGAPTRRFVVRAEIIQIENGFIVKIINNDYDVSRDYYAEDLKAAGERIAAMGVAIKVEGK